MALHVVQGERDPVSECRSPARFTLREAELDARRLLDATDAASHRDGDTLLQPREQCQLLCAMQPVADLLDQCAQGEGNTRAERQGLCSTLRSATEALNRATMPLAERRMDARVRRAFSGQHVNQIAPPEPRNVGGLG